MHQGRKELIKTNKIRKVSSSDTLTNILEDAYKGIIAQDVLLTKTCFLFSWKKRGGRSWKGWNNFFGWWSLVKVISYEVHLEEEAAADKD